MEEKLARSVWFWLLIASIMILQSTWLFLDARKRERMPWFWGLWGLIQFPLPLITYWLVVRRGIFGRWKKQNARMKKGDTDNERND